MNRAKPAGVAASAPARRGCENFLYLFTCEYCFSHYVAALALWVFHLSLLYAGWRGYLAAWLALVWIANVYMSLFNRLRLEIKHENVEIKKDEKDVDNRR